ncbi:hypothetical protein HKD28_15075 [Gluconobacter sp. LMG 1744]|uniref:hypothetical protein n=1 Tax=Gluconobacter cadivus TaxID=2728101 RepID=UPI001884C1A3|nr:hypothetical protein [Gluconobacter cadivus]MBF0892713.1 hypothetical protein [Gluconobacter cadivus]
MHFNPKLFDKVKFPCPADRIEWDKPLLLPTEDNNFFHYRGRVNGERSVSMAIQYCPRLFARMPAFINCSLYSDGAAGIMFGRKFTLKPDGKFSLMVEWMDFVLEDKGITKARKGKSLQGLKTNKWRRAANVDSFYSGSVAEPDFIRNCQLIGIPPAPEWQTPDEQLLYKLTF